MNSLIYKMCFAAYGHRSDRTGERNDLSLRRECVVCVFRYLNKENMRSIDPSN